MAANPLFVDTSAWYAYYVDKSDADHSSAVNVVRNLNHPLITSETLAKLSKLVIPAELLSGNLVLFK